MGQGSGRCQELYHRELFLRQGPFHQGSKEAYCGRRESGEGRGMQGKRPGMEVEGVYAWNACGEQRAEQGGNSRGGWLGCRVSLGRAQPCTGRATTRGQRRRIKEHSTWRPTTRSRAPYSPLRCPVPPTIVLGYAPMREWPVPRTILGLSGTDIRCFAIRCSRRGWRQLRRLKALVQPALFTTHVTQLAQY
eukprot:3906462-Rhodomonas_salina.2